VEEIRAVRLTEEDELFILDQRKLPQEEVYIVTRDYREVIYAIRTLAVRGAPLIGIAAGYGVYLAIKELGDNISFDDFYRSFTRVKEEFANSRPTAKNLFFVLDLVDRLIMENRILPVRKLKSKIRAFVMKIEEKEKEASFRISEFGSRLINKKSRILTHCNTGSLATSGLGTALGIIKMAWKSGLVDMVFVDETRPLLQGARLTSWELEKLGIPYRIVTDNMVGYLMSKGLVDYVIVGADRITKRGDVANKIGTYVLAVLCNYHSIPFIVAAPTSTFDFSIEKGEDIVIEHRNEEEILSLAGCRIAPSGARAMNPAFDVTPSRLVSFIVTEKGVLEPPFEENIERLVL
jgi:methylthioribose-1-phosphate isomerase